MTKFLSEAEESYKSGNYIEALKLYQKIWDENDEIISSDNKTVNRIYIKQQIGNCYMMLEQYDKAIESFNEMILIDKTYAVSYANIALSLLRQGKTMDAMQYLIRIEQANIDFPEWGKKMLKEVNMEVDAKLIFEPSIFNNFLKDE